MQVLQCLLFCCIHSHSHEFHSSLVLIWVFCCLPACSTLTFLPRKRVDAVVPGVPASLERQRNKIKVSSIPGRGSEGNPFQASWEAFHCPFPLGNWNTLTVVPLKSTD